MPLQNLSSKKMRRCEKAVIFDCDGVLFDSKASNISYYNHLLNKYGMPLLKNEDIEFIHMHTADECIHYLFKESPYLSEVLEYRWKMPLDEFIRQMKMEDGLIEALEELRPYYYLAIATNRSNSIPEVLSYFGLTQYFDKVVSALDVKNPKPDPECIKIIIEFLKISKTNVIFIGDSKIDELTATFAGVPFIAYKNPNLIADFHAESLFQVVSYIKDTLPPESKCEELKEIPLHKRAARLS